MPRVDVSMTPAEVDSFLAIPRTGVLTTLDPDGWPHSIGMWFFVRNGELHMWAYAKSQKVKNVGRDARTALLVESGDGYDTLKGVLVRGRARVITAHEEICDIGRELYLRYTYPTTGVPVEQGPEIEIVRQAHKRVGLVVPCERVTSWDHAKMK